MPSQQRESSKAYRIESCPNRGRYMVAAENLASDTLILSSSSYAVAVFDNFKKRVCSSCLSLPPSASPIHPLRCSSCDQVYFCSQVCSSYHLRPGRNVTHESTICSILRKLATSKLGCHEKSVLKGLIMLFYQKYCQEEDCQGLDLSKLSLNASEVPQSTWNDVLHLQSHYSHWTMDTKNEWAKAQKLIIPLFQDLNWIPQNFEIARQQVMDTVSRIESNGFGLWTLDGRCMGRGVFPSASFLNHSCDPNCLSVQDGQVMKVFTSRDVRVGEELCISYIDSNAPLQTRRTRLKEDYAFDCSCSRCTQEVASGRSTRKITYPKSSLKKPSGKNKQRKKDKDLLELKADSIMQQENEGEGSTLLN